MNGYGLRLFLGFAGLVLVMLLVSAAVFFSLFGGYSDQIDRSELRTAGNALRVEIARILRRATDYDEVVTLSREQADHAGLIVVLTDEQGNVFAGFEPEQSLKGSKVDIRYADLEEKSGPGGWVDHKLFIGGDWRASLVRTVIPPTGRGRAGSGVLMAVAFADQHRIGALDDLFDRLAVSGMAGLAAAVGLAMLLSRQLMRPLEALTGVVNRFGPDRYDMRAAETGPTQVRELAAAFNAMAERVADNERTMRGFIADVSHELRTPLTSIRGFVEALRDGTVTNPERQAASLEIVYEETQRMLRMIQQLLDLSRLESRQERLQLTELDLEELFGYLEAMFEATADDAGVTLSFTIAPYAPTIEADYDRLLQVCNNLLDNAIRHTPAGTVRVSARGEAGGLQLAVADSGEGMPPEALERLFDRFWQPEDRSGPGAGLGLAITREIVRAHDGQITAQSEPTVGTTITVWLPQQRTR